MKTLADVEMQMAGKGYQMVALEKFPGWGITWNGELIVGPVTYEEAEDEMIRLAKVEEVRS